MIPIVKIRLSYLYNGNPLPGYSLYIESGPHAVKRPLLLQRESKKLRPGSPGVSVSFWSIYQIHKYFCFCYNPLGANSFQKLWIYICISHSSSMMKMYNFDGLLQERCNSIANALELHLSCTYPSICPCGPKVMTWEFWTGDARDQGISRPSNILGPPDLIKHIHTPGHHWFR